MKGDINVETLTPWEFVIYIIFFIVITWCFEFIPGGQLERFTAEICSHALNILGFPSSWGVLQGEAYLSMIGGLREVSVTIIRECTGIHVFAIFAGLVFPLRGGLWLKKTMSLAVAGLFLLVLNMSRVILTILLTAYDVPPFSWIFTNPTVETYHYPLSFIYGLLGVAILVVIIDRWILPELCGTFIRMFNTLYNLVSGAKSSSC